MPLNLQQQIVLLVARKVLDNPGKHSDGLVLTAGWLVSDMYELWEDNPGWPKNSIVWHRFTALLPVEKWAEILGTE